jgi:hypothetical protein
MPGRLPRLPACWPGCAPTSRPGQPPRPSGTRGEGTGH